MRIVVKLAFDEGGAVRLLNWLAGENTRILKARPDVPLLYASGVIYRREKVETWGDVLNTLAQGWEDCDALSAWRAGELMARGYKALSPGDGGYREARRKRTRSLEAEVFLRTRAPVGHTGLYHCIVRYRVGNRWYRDDPSARLGMYGPDRLENPWGDRPENAPRGEM
ncbi:MAG: hypothetical protein ACI8RZ_001476 [Myxococcota bacterium]|jgi:hypothetical protein